MPDRKQTHGKAPELDPRLVEVVRQEVRLQVAQTLERLVGELRQWAVSAPGPTGGAPGGSAAPGDSSPGQLPAGIDRRTIVVLSAAVAAVLKRPARINRITFLNQNTISAWAEAGRMTIHNSHRLGRTI